MEKPLEGKLVLIADDEDLIREMLRDELELLGAKTLEAANGKEGLEKVKTNAIHFIVSDVRMPGGDGIDFLKNVRSLHPRTPDFIMVTGFADLQVDDAFAWGAQALLAKPIDFDRLNAEFLKAATPRLERWKSAPEKFTMTPVKLNLTLEDFTTSCKAGYFDFGSSGFFISWSDRLPSVNQPVEFKLSWKKGSLIGDLEGQGYVRWVRGDEKDGFKKGYGVEITRIFNNADEWNKIVVTENKVAYIPKGKC